jgi:23S rRNA (cytosine1962-C5)-methyltransferase
MTTPRQIAAVSARQSPGFVGGARNALALRCVAPGGLLATASCTSQIDPEAFKELLAAAGAGAGKHLQIIHEAGQPIDHPVPAHFPEGRYLKFVVGRVGERA